RGRGLFAGVEFVNDKKTREPADESLVGRILALAAADGVLAGRMNRSVPDLNNVLTLAPAYVITREEIDRITQTLKKAILACCG
ncbi:MAG: aspartate aminotransferase family protein, partial [Desulfovibrio sp.]|nr:aspartate aminotransferase family protein [Desulfovibrio sp.]